MMFDKYHYEWIYNDFHTQVKIFNAQKRAFDFMKQLGDDAYSVAKEVKDLKEKTLDLQASLEYYKHKCGELMNE